MKKWLTLDRQHKYTSTIFKHDVVKRQSQDTGVEGFFDVVQCLDWVNVIPVTAEGEVVLVRQYRQGVDDITLEIPGGAVHRGEEHEKAARRELEEETGYRAPTWVDLGSIDPNPAFMSNVCKTFLAEGAVPEGEMNLDPLEEIEIQRVPLEDIPSYILQGKITHSLVIAGFYLYREYRKD